LKDPGSIRKWARRVFSRTQFSERVNIISQKVHVKWWADIARSQSLPLRSKWIMFSTWMRLSFLSTLVKTRYLVFFLHNFFPPFIIDPGSFGADLMTSWS